MIHSLIVVLTVKMADKQQAVPEVKASLSEVECALALFIKKKEEAERLKKEAEEAERLKKEEEKRLAEEKEKIQALLAQMKELGATDEEIHAFIDQAKSTKTVPTVSFADKLRAASKSITTNDTTTQQDDEPKLSCFTAICNYLNGDNPETTYDYYKNGEGFNFSWNDRLSSSQKRESYANEYDTIRVTDNLDAILHVLFMKCSAEDEPFDVLQELMEKALAIIMPEGDKYKRNLNSITFTGSQYARDTSFIKYTLDDDKNVAEYYVFNDIGEDITMTHNWHYTFHLFATICAAATNQESYVVKDVYHKEKWCLTNYICDQANLTTFLQKKYGRN